MQLCHKYGIMVVGGLIFGFPDDDEEAIIENYRFLKSIDADTAYCQILTPYPKTVMRQHLLDEGLVTNVDDLPVVQRHVGQCEDPAPGSGSVAVPFLVPSSEGHGLVGAFGAGPEPGPLWTAIWLYVFPTVAQSWSSAAGSGRHGWRGRYEQGEDRASVAVNRFAELDDDGTKGESAKVPMEEGERIDLDEQSPRIKR